MTIVYFFILLLLLFIDYTQNGTQYINIYNTHRIKTCTYKTSVSCNQFNDSVNI